MAQPSSICSVSSLRLTSWKSLMRCHVITLRGVTPSGHVKIGLSRRSGHSFSLMKSSVAPPLTGSCMSVMCLFCFTVQSASRRQLVDLK